MLNEHTGLEVPASTPKPFFARSHSSALVRSFSLPSLALLWLVAKRSGFPAQARQRVHSSHVVERLPAATPGWNAGIRAPISRYMLFLPQPHQLDVPPGSRVPPSAHPLRLPSLRIAPIYARCGSSRPRPLPPAVHLELDHVCVGYPSGLIPPHGRAANGTRSKQGSGGSSPVPVLFIWIHHLNRNLHGHMIHMICT